MQKAQAPGEAGTVASLVRIARGLAMGATSRCQHFAARAERTTPEIRDQRGLHITATRSVAADVQSAQISPTESRPFPSGQRTGRLARTDVHGYPLVCLRCEASLASWRKIT